nr:MAG TPA: hypothetical protein [Caudoviricetes sp.]
MGKKLLQTISGFLIFGEYLHRIRLYILTS